MVADLRLSIQLLHGSGQAHPIKHLLLSGYFDLVSSNIMLSIVVVSRSSDSKKAIGVAETLMMNAGRSRDLDWTGSSRLV